VSDGDDDVVEEEEGEEEEEVTETGQRICMHGAPSKCT